MARSRRTQMPVFVALAYLALIALFMVAPGIFTPYDALTTQASDAFRPPSADHLLGTDQVGRDVWTRIVYGAQSSVVIGLIATVIAALVGATVGTITAVTSRFAAYSLTRSVEVLMALPEFLLALMIVALAGPGPITIMVALAIVAIPAYANVARGVALTQRSSESVRGATILGLSPSRIFVRYLLAESIQPVLALATLGVGVTILAAAGLSFLGLGVQAPTPNWGLMLAESRSYFDRAWWLVVFPGLFLSLTVGAFTVLGKSIERRLR